MNPDDDLIQLAITRGLVSSGDVAGARARLETKRGAKDSPSGLLEALQDEGTLTARQVAEFLASELDLAVMTGLADVHVPVETLQFVPRAHAVRHGLLPLAHDRWSLRIAIGDPFDIDGIDGLHHLTGLDVETTVAPVDELRAAIDRSYGHEVVAAAESSADEDRFAVDSAGADPDSAGEIEGNGAADAPIIALVQSIIQKAVLRGASDIHFEPLEKRFRVRYRIDGTLVEAGNPPKRLQASIISRLKIMANISIAEKRVPQDGRIQVVVAGRSLDLRVASLPTGHGESIVMRILDRAGLKTGLAELGLSSSYQRLFGQLIQRPDGILLVTGPTGSGKTTTLYSCLGHLNQPDRKIITVEDPVEYQLAGINQVPVRAEIGMTFAAALRAMLRQSPNIVMVGEIRDRETAETAINASLTGHMVFSTLHTNDAPGAVIRLLDMGVKPFLLASSLRAVLAQRLVRTNCPACSRPCQPGPEELRLLNITPDQAAGASFKKGGGCGECEGTGYRGRTGIFELLVVDDGIRALIHAQAGLSELREKARSLGLRTLREDGIAKIIAGLTTIEEVVSITVDDSD